MPVPGNLLPIFAEIRGVEDNVLVSFFARDLRRQWICKVKCVSRQAYFEFLEGKLRRASGSAPSRFEELQASPRSPSSHADTIPQSRFSWLASEVPRRRCAVGRSRA